MVVFTVMILSVLLHACESWALTKAQLLRLEVFQRACLRQLPGVRCRDCMSDEDLYAQCAGIERIETHWRRRVLRWLGHLGRMDSSRIPKQLLWSTLPDGRRRRGRPLTTLSLIYSEHLKTLRPLIDQMRRTQSDIARGFNWLNACANRDAWREMVG